MIVLENVVKDYVNNYIQSKKQNINDKDIDNYNMFLYASIEDL